MNKDLDEKMDDLLVKSLLGEATAKEEAELQALMAAQPDAAIVNVTSGLAFVPLVATPTYSATKAAIHSYTVSLRDALKGRVEVIELAPPGVQTDGRAALVRDGRYGAAMLQVVWDGAARQVVEVTQEVATRDRGGERGDAATLTEAERRSWTAGGSEPRPASRLFSSAQDGGARNTSCASGARARTWRAPCSSISSSAGAPVARRSRTGATGVP